MSVAVVQCELPGNLWKYRLRRDDVANDQLVALARWLATEGGVEGATNLKRGIAHKKIKIQAGSKNFKFINKNYPFSALSTTPIARVLPMS